MSQLEWPLFVFRKDGVLELCESLADAQRKYEGIDVEAREFEFYEFSGTPARPVFIKPNKHSSFLGMFSYCSSGVFTFERDATLEIDPIDIAMLEISILARNNRFEDMNQVRRHLESCGCSMERSRSRETEDKDQASGGNGE